MAIVSVDTILKLINNEKVNHTIYVDSKFIVRKSCGCSINNKDSKNTHQNEQFEHEDLIKYFTQSANTLYVVTKYIEETQMKDINISELLLSTVAFYKRKCLATWKTESNGNRNLYVKEGIDFLNAKENELTKFELSIKPKTFLQVFLKI